MKLRTIDLFCGGGGSSWGAQIAGAEIIAGIDAWELACDVYQDNFQHARVVNRMLKPRSSARVLDGIGEIDLLLASPECTNHTCAKGNRPVDENSRGTARYVLNFARHFEPRWIVLENVVHMRSWSGYSDLISKLERDYHVSPQILDASKFGVPQKRRRLFLVCDREAPPPEILPQPGCASLTAADILDPPGTWSAGPLFDNNRAEGTIARAQRAIDALGEGEPFLVVYYGSDGSGGWQPLGRPLRTLTTLDRFGLIEWDSGRPTLRMLQVPELRRAMGFSDHYRLDRGTRRDRIKVLGNSVAPPVMEAIVSQLTNPHKRVVGSQQPLPLKAA